MCAVFYCLSLRIPQWAVHESAIPAIASDEGTSLHTKQKRHQEVDAARGGDVSGVMVCLLITRWEIRDHVDVTVLRQCLLNGCNHVLGNQ